MGKSFNSRWVGDLTLSEALVSGAVTISTANIPGNLTKVFFFKKIKLTGGGGGAA